MRAALVIMSLWTFGMCAQGNADSLSGSPIIQMDLYAEGQWSSNALNKFVVAGVAFGGDISSPVRSLTALTHWKGQGFAGGTTRSGVRMVLPALELFETPGPRALEDGHRFGNFTMGLSRLEPGGSHPVVWATRHRPRWQLARLTLSFDFGDIAPHWRHPDPFQNRARHPHVVVHGVGGENGRVAPLHFWRGAAGERIPVER